MSQKTEIEVKLFGIDATALRVKLLGSGARQSYSGSIRTTHYDFPDGRLTKAGEYLRVRTYDDGRGVLTHKGSNTGGDIAERTETETGIADAKALSTILRLAGFIPILESTRRRESYTYINYQYDIDTYPGIPPFLEVEVPAREDLVQALAVVGARNEDTFSGTILDYLAQQGRQPESIGITLHPTIQPTMPPA